jgi:hypothetical protein
VLQTSEEAEARRVRVNSDIGWIDIHARVSETLLEHAHVERGAQNLGRVILRRAEPLALRPGHPLVRREGGVRGAVVLGDAAEDVPVHAGRLLAAGEVH